MLDKKLPQSCMASAGIYRWTGNDHYGYGEQFMGNQGTIEVMNRKDLYFYPEPHGDVAGQKRPEVHLNGPTEFGEADGQVNHVRNFIEAIRGNEKVIAPPSAGQQAAISGHMATLSFRNNRKVFWDTAKNNVRLG